VGSFACQKHIKPLLDLQRSTSIKGEFVITLKFKNWDKYNKRQKDIRRPFWFAMSNEIFLDPFYSDLNDQERQAFLWLLCEASRQNKYGELDVSSKLFSQITGYKTSVLDAVIDKLLKSGAAAGWRQDGGKIATATEHNKTEHNKTEQDKKLLAQTDESASLSYPNEYLEISDVFDQRKVKAKITCSWVEAYPDSEWVMQEIRKALAWEVSNPQRRKKDFGRFMTNWLSRSWDSRKSHQVINKAEQRDAHNAAAAKEALRILGIE
jgi:hypothetical protein